MYAVQDKITKECSPLAPPALPAAGCCKHLLEEISGCWNQAGPAALLLSDGLPLPGLLLSVHLQEQGLLHWAQQPRHG